MNMDVLVQYFARRNLGDDLFIHILAGAFPDCRLRLVGHPFFHPRGLPENVTLHPVSWSRLAWRCVQRVIGRDSALSHRIGKRNLYRLRSLADRSEAYVNIGGSIFVDQGGAEIPFSGEGEPCLDWVSEVKARDHHFLIGANLGPMRTEDYPRRMYLALRTYTHVCLRDWASYTMVRQLTQAQYAPDLVFMLPQPETVQTQQRTVISVIDMHRVSGDASLADSYEQLMARTADEPLDRGGQVTLCAFCRSQGDLAAARRIAGKMRGKAEILCYNGDPAPVLEAIAAADQVIAGRFHAMILALSWGKAVFPVAYDCKTRHYLEDLRFPGRWAAPADIPRLTPADVLENYDRRVICDCAAHRQHAGNQLRALRTFVDAHKGQTNA